MLSSENKYAVTISINQKVEGILLTLINGTFETVYSGYGTSLNLEIVQGIYKLKASFIDYTQEYPLIIDNDETFYFDFNYATVAPILPFKSSHAYFCDNCEAFSKTQTDLPEDGAPNFLFFAAKYDRACFPGVIMSDLLPHYAIFDINNKLLHQFERENARSDSKMGWLAFSTKLKNGLYFLQWNSETGRRIFPFYIYENFQTQFFIRYNEVPDFNNCAFFYSKSMSFNHESEEYLVFDKILFAYRDYKNYQLLTERDKDIIHKTPYLVSLIQILQLTLFNEIRDFKDCERLSLPDIALLTEKGYLEKMPIISSSMTQYTFNNQNSNVSFRPASLIDRVIDHLNYDLFWNSFSSIDNTIDWISLYSKLLARSDVFPVSNKDGALTKLSKRLLNSFIKTGKTTLEERLNILIGKIHRKRTVSDALNSIKLLSAISEKLNVPPTKVLRNYDVYKEIYDKLK